MAFDHDHPLALSMTMGGDARILLDPETRLNRYSSAPYPRDVLALASSTANDLSSDAASHLLAHFGSEVAALSQGDGYAAFLDQCRDSLSAAYALPKSTQIFFAPSGTDLEYVALFAVAGKAKGGICNVLLGANEVGSGCIHSAAGCYFAHETALGVAVAPKQPVAGMTDIILGDIAVRDLHGVAQDSASMAAAMVGDIEGALARGLHPLAHVVHGSKTGLVLPQLDDIDRLIARFGDQVSFVVDACQARITTQAIHDYLLRGIIVFLTGSKFMGGPPFSGFALIPEQLVNAAAPLPDGARTIFRRAEVPTGWAGRDRLDDGGNEGLALRLAASLFELERFQGLPIDEVKRLVGAFSSGVGVLAAQLGVRIVSAAAPSESGELAEHPIEMQTLATLDLCHDSSGAQRRALDFDDATRIHKVLIGQGIRLGQPVKCVKLVDGRWGATLRVGVSMPQLVALSDKDNAEVTAAFAAMLGPIGKALAAEL